MMNLIVQHAVLLWCCFFGGIVVFVVATVWFNIVEGGVGWPGISPSRITKAIGIGGLVVAALVAIPCGLLALRWTILFVTQ